MNAIDIASVAYTPNPLAEFFARMRYRFFPPKSNMESFAESELARIGGDGDGMQAEMNRHILKMVREFGREGHSGFSASYAVSILEKLLRFEPLTPLTGDDDEWNDISDMNGAPLWQSRRCSHVFKGTDGAYDIRGRIFREPDGACFTSRDSRVPVAFPYVPHTEYVDVPEDRA